MPVVISAEPSHHTTSSRDNVGWALYADEFPAPRHRPQYSPKTYWLFSACLYSYSEKR